jgi:hypothetical protein
MTFFVGGNYMEFKLEYRKIAIFVIIALTVLALGTRVRLVGRLGRPRMRKLHVINEAGRSIRLHRETRKFGSFS